MTPFSSIEVHLIKASLCSRSDGEIAAMLERPIEEIHAEINRLTGGQAKARSFQIQAEREEIREKKKAWELARDKRLAEARQSKLSRKVVDIVKLERREQQAREREQNRKLKEEKRAKEDNERKERSNRIRDELERKKKRDLAQRKYATKEVDLSTLQSVRVDQKTIVFVKPGADVKKIVAMYRNKLASSLNKAAI